MASYMFAPYALTGSLVDAINNTGGDWEYAKFQEELELLTSEKLEKELKHIPELDYIATDDTKKLKEFFGRYEIGVSPKDYANVDLGMATFMQLDGQWPKPGTESVIIVNTVEYAATEVKNAWVLNRRPNEFALETKSGDVLFFLQRQLANSGLELVFEARDYVKEHLPKLDDAETSAAKLPKVVFDDEVRIDFLLDSVLVSKKHETVLDFAYKHVVFNLDEKGAKAKVSSAVMGSKSAPIKPIAISKPFTFIWHRDGCTYPLLVGYLEKEVWLRAKRSSKD